MTKGECMEISDKEVIIKIKRGEINYYRYIVNRYSKKIRNFIYQKLFDKEDVDDLVQNVFLNFYKATGRFDENKKVVPYLFQIVKNELKMYYRSKKVTVSLDETFYLQDDRLVVDNWEESNEEIKINLKKLPNNQRNSLHLLSEGFSYEEIALKLKKPINSVRTLIRRGRIKLKKYYEKTGR